MTSTCKCAGCPHGDDEVRGLLLSIAGWTDPMIRVPPHRIERFSDDHSPEPAGSGQAESENLILIVKIKFPEASNCLRAQMVCRDVLMLLAAPPAATRQLAAYLTPRKPFHLGEEFPNRAKLG